MFTAIVHPDMYCQLTRRCTTTSIGPTTRLEISNDQLTLRMSFANTIDMIGYDDTYRMYMLYMYACTMCMKLPLLTPSPFCLEKEHYSRHIHIIICFDSCFVLDWIYFNILAHSCNLQNFHICFVSARLPASPPSLLPRFGPGGQAFAVNEIGRSEWSEWSEELETHPFASGCFMDVSGGDGLFKGMRDVKN